MAENLVMDSTEKAEALNVFLSQGKLASRSLHTPELYGKEDSQQCIEIHRAGWDSSAGAERYSWYACEAAAICKKSWCLGEVPDNWADVTLNFKKGQEDLGNRRSAPLQSLVQ